MDNYHYLKAPLDDDISAEILERYLESLDPNRLIFVASDIKAFEVYANRFDDFLRVGYIKPAFDIFKVFRERVQERIAAAHKLLDGGFDYELDETYAFRRQRGELGERQHSAS